jgi:hypothetical protein
LSDDCVEAFLMVLKELERDRPEPDHMYGEMDARHCVYMVELPDCDGHRLVASVDRKGDRLSPTILHLVIAFGEDAVDRARREAARQLKLVNPSWDPKK